MKYLLITVLLCSSFLINAQSDDRRTEWRASKKLKLDLFNLMDEYSTLLIGYEYPLKNGNAAIGHELGAILGGGYGSSEIQQARGFKTSHTYLLYSKNSRYAIGGGLHFRQLNVQGRLTACAAISNDQFGGCSYFQIFEDPIKTQRWAGYVRLRRQLYSKRRIMFAIGMDIGGFVRRITNDEFKEDNLTLPNRWLSQDLNNGSGIYFRSHAQLIYRL